MSAFSDAIASENEELLRELLQAELAAKVANVCGAVAKGNLGILRALMERWPIDQLSMTQVLLTIPFVDHEEDKKLEILRCLLPYYYSEERYSSIPTSLPRVILCYFTEKHFLLEEFLINKYYKLKRSENSHYPLIKKLQLAINEWHHLCIFLHGDTDHISALDVYGVVGILIQLLLKDTREDMELAVATFQVLLNTELFNKALETNSLNIYSMNIKQALNDPLMRRLFFQLIYNSINEETQEEICLIIELWFKIYGSNDDIYKLLIQFLGPFIGKPIPLIRKRVFELILKENEENEIRSLKELSKDVVRCQVFQNAKNVKEFMDLIWSFDLPVTLKCFLLNIPDASYMNTLKMS